MRWSHLCIIEITDEHDTSLLAMTIDGKIPCDRTQQAADARNLNVPFLHGGKETGERLRHHVVHRIGTVRAELATCLTENSSVIPLVEQRQSSLRPGTNPLEQLRLRDHRPP
ncbi:MAG: hypothetical protein RLY45_2323 [Actinomycetota bacterium]